MKIIYVGKKSRPCGTSEGQDISLFKKNAKNIGKILTMGDIVLCDKVFSGKKMEELARSNGFNIIAGFKKKKDNDLPLNKKILNKSISKNRISIERVYGILKEKFLILDEKFTYNCMLSKYYNDIFKLCCALYNIDKFYQDIEVDVDESEINNDNILGQVRFDDENDEPLFHGTFNIQDEYLTSKGSSIENENISSSLTEQNDKSSDNKKRKRKNFEIDSNTIGLIKIIIEELKSNHFMVVADAKRLINNAIDVMTDSESQSGLRSEIKSIYDSIELINFLESII